MRTLLALLFPVITLLAQTQVIPPPAGGGGVFRSIRQQYPGADAKKKRDEAQKLLKEAEGDDTVAPAAPEAVKPKPE